MSDFFKLWNLLDKIATLAGIETFSKKKWNLKWKIFSGFSGISLILFVFILCDNIIYNPDIIMAIIITIITFNIIFSVKIAYDLTVNGNKFLSLLSWCQSRHENSWNKVVEPIAKHHFDLALKKSLKFVKCALTYWLTVVLITTLLFPIVTFFITGELKLSVPVYYPFVSADTVNGFIINYLLATHPLTICQFVLAVHTSLLYTSTTYLIAQMDILIEVIKKINIKDKIEFEVIKNKVLADILEDLELEQEIILPEDTLTFQEWLKLVVDMHSDIIEKFQILVDATSIATLMIEMTSFSSMLMAWSLVVVAKDRQELGLGMTSLILLSFFVAYLNEQLLEKFHQVSTAIYDIPWYNLSPKERIPLVFILNLAQKPPSLTAGGFGDQTYERFGDVTYRAYSVCLVLQKLLEQTLT